jgi:hypothetical protein
VTAIAVVCAVRPCVLFFIRSFPKTYPQNAHPTFSVHQPIKGLSSEQCTKLSHAILAEVRQYVGEEMVFQVRRLLAHEVRR